MIRDSFTYLYESENGLVTTLIGGVLTLLGFLLIPAILVDGYLVEVLRRTAAANDEPPRFEDWGRLFVDGLKATAIWVLYVAIPGMVLAFAGIGVLAGIFSAAPADGGAITGILGVGALSVIALVALVVWMLGLYVTPAAIAHFVTEDRLGAAIEFGTLRPILTGSAYATGWATAAAVLVAGMIVASVLSAVPILGSIVGVFVMFYAAVAAVYVIGHTWNDVRPDASEAETVAPSERPAV